jgi:hypothetical protein
MRLANEGKFISFILKKVLVYRANKIVWFDKGTSQRKQPSLNNEYWCHILELDTG